MYFVKRITALAVAVALVLCSSPLFAADATSNPKVDRNKPVQVFILLGQSNMLGFGKVGEAEEPGSLTHAIKGLNKYNYLVNDKGEWIQRKDVRNVRVMSSANGPMQEFNNEWMTISGKHIGTEIAIGHLLGNATDSPVLILKSCIGNRSLGWDLLPPGSKRFEKDGMVYGGYKDPLPSWKKGEEPTPGKWYGGIQYDGDIANAKKVLSELEKYYPDAKKYEIAGFFWWQGDKDRYDDTFAQNYEKNLVQLIKQLRKDFNAPNAKFVCATLGQTERGAEGNDGKILGGQLAVDGKTGKYPEFKGNVATVYSQPLCHGGSSASHYGGNAETYMDVGEAMGKAMLDLMGLKAEELKGSRPLSPEEANLIALKIKAIAGEPGSYDQLYEAAKKRFPKETLPFAYIYLKADKEKFGPKVKEALTKYTQENVMPDYVAANGDALGKELKALDAPTYRAIDGLVRLYRSVGVNDYDWHSVGPELGKIQWDYFTFDPPEKQAYDKSPWRFRKVTYPKGMENWFASDFNPSKAGWKQGSAPFGQLEGKLVTDAEPCSNTSCKHAEPMKTLWDKEVLLLRAKVKVPPPKPGYLYRVRIGSGQHVGSGAGYELYVNGKLMGSAKNGNGRGQGGKPRYVPVTEEFLEDFKKGEVTIAATTFLRYGSRAKVTMPPVPQGIFSLWVEEMKLPPIKIPEK